MKLVTLSIAFALSLGVLRADSFTQSHSFSGDVTSIGTIGPRIQETWSIQSFNPDMGTLESVEISYSFVGAAQIFNFMLEGYAPRTPAITASTVFTFWSSEGQVLLTGPSNTVYGPAVFVPHEGRFGLEADMNFSGTVITSEPYQLNFFDGSQLSFASGTFFQGDSKWGETSAQGTVDVSISFHYTVPDTGISLALLGALIIAMAVFSRRLASV
jgi:hypothetical protein